MKASILTFSAATFLVIACVPVGAQQTSGTPGSPSATTTIDGKQLPPPTGTRGGAIRVNALQSKAWWVFA